MIKITKFALLLYLLNTSLVLAQTMLKQIPLNEQIKKATLVVEGQVISKASFWDITHRNIYTINTIEIYKVFKGKPTNTIEVITQGGSVGLKALAVSPSLNLQKGDIGLFNLIDNNIVIDSNGKIKNKQFKPYGSLQGYYKYNLHSGIAVNSFNKKIDISTSLYNDIVSLTKANYIDIKTLNIQSKINKSSFPPNSITFSPTTVTAGTKSTITINGTDFGTIKGKVEFSNADDGGDTYTNALNTQILSWTDTEIKVEVPSRAGTGQIQITNNNNQFGVSAEVLIVIYSEFNIESDDIPSENSGIDFAYQVQHINTNNNGGYTWKMHTNFFNDMEFSGARASFERAIETWRCASGINWILDESPSNTDDNPTKSDGTNIVRFDNGSELGVGILGTCYSWYSGCITENGSAEWFVEELDIVFDDDTNWYFETDLPGVNQYDFETVALHELGHGHQLGHVINTNNEAMHFSTFSGAHLRSLSNNSIEVATTIQKRNTNSSVCSELSMFNYQCDSTGSNENLENSISVFPVPTQQQFYIKNKSAQKLDKVIVFDIRNRQIFEYEIINNLNIISINLIGVSKGIYFIDIYSGNEIVTKKLLLK